MFNCSELSPQFLLSELSSELHSVFALTGTMAKLLDGYYKVENHFYKLFKVLYYTEYNYSFVGKGSRRILI